jgi:transposase
MSLRPDPIGPIPEETVRVAQAAFPRGTAWMRLRDVLGPIYEDAMFAPLFSQRGRPAEAPWRLALVSVMQFAERLSDRKAADAVRGRIDWKYALGLPLDDAGFDASVLCEFRGRLLAGNPRGRFGAPSATGAHAVNDSEKPKCAVLAGQPQASERGAPRG